ncbi:MAG: class D sortase [Clostridia bacterium]|nr:class D sortase [Clostridia bacterium]
MRSIILKTIKATIIPIIVALLITGVFLLGIKLFAGAQIDEVITLANLVTIETEQKKEAKETTLNLETNMLQNYPDYGSQYATIQISSIDLDLPVYFGSTLEILRKGVGHDSGSYFPGEGGSIIYMGHNSSNVFRRFGELQLGDEITIKADYGEFKYKIYDFQLISEKEGDKLPIQKDKEMLMVYTCFPFVNIGHATQRYVVFAELEK